MQRAGAYTLTRDARLVKVEGKKRRVTVEVPMAMCLDDSIKDMRPRR